MTLVLITMILILSGCYLLLLGFINWCDKLVEGVGGGEK